MKIGDIIRPAAQVIDAGVLAQLFKASPGAYPGSDPSFLTAYGSSPLVGKMFTNAHAINAVGIEGGFGVSTANAEQYFGKVGTMLRKQVRIDKCPWPDGQQDIQIRVTLQYSQGVGADRSAAPDKVVELKWDRNTSYHFSLTSGTAPATPFQLSLGYTDGSVGVDFLLQAFGVGAGQPLVQADGNPYTDTFVTLDVTNANFSNGADYWYSSQSRHHMLPCPQWSNAQIDFPGDAYGYFTAAIFHSALGLVETCSWQIEAIGWDTGYDDDMTDDPNIIELPTGP